MQKQKTVHLSSCDNDSNDLDMSTKRNSFQYPSQVQIFAKAPPSFYDEEREQQAQ